jgi:hypothetical protein
MGVSKRTNAALWGGQWLLGLFFALGSGAPKLFLPAERLNLPLELPGWFVVFVGIAEVLGGLGLVLPGLLRVRPGLTPLAAGGLVLVTIGATGYQLLAGQIGGALFALGVGLVVAGVGYGRWRVAPLRGSAPALRRALA